MDPVYEQILHELFNRLGGQAVNAIIGGGSPQHSDSVVPFSPPVHSTPRGSGAGLKRQRFRVSETSSSNGSGSPNPGGSGDPVDFHMSGPGNSTMGSAGAGSNLQLETVGGKPSYTPERSLKGDYRISEQERTIATQYKMRVESSSVFNSDAINYIPWETIHCHAYENIAAELHDVIEWKPLRAEVTFSEGRAFFDVPATANAGTNLRDVDHLKLRFLNLSELAPLNTTIFEKYADFVQWLTLKDNDNGNISIQPPARSVKMGYSPVSWTDIKYTDAQWLSVDIGDNQFHSISWDHTPHVDSPWRYTQELMDLVFKLNTFKTGSTTDATAPLFELQMPNPCRMVLFPRFDYMRGFTISPRFHLNTIGAWSNCINNANNSTLCYESAWHPIMDYSLGANNRRLKDWSAQGAQGRFFDRYNNYLDTENVQSGMYTGTEGKQGVVARSNVEYTKYFENNTMRPILFIMERINNTAGIQPLYANFTVTIKHKIKVRCWHKDGMNRNEKFDLMTLGTLNDPNNFPAGQNMPDLNDLRIPTYYLKTNHQGLLGQFKEVIHSERSTKYVPAAFPIIVGNSLETIEESSIED